METINYQGRAIEAEKINYVDGSLCVAVYGEYHINHEGEEQLWRDGTGRYYLRRELVICDRDGTTEHFAQAGVLVHRLSLTAAAQWAAMRTSALEPRLRRDLAGALTPAHGLSATTLATLAHLQRTSPLAPFVDQYIACCLERYSNEPERNESGREAEREGGRLARLDHRLSLSRRPAHAPADIALLAAAKPEAVEDDEEPLVEEEHVDDHDDDPAHIRTTLRVIAADWRTKAQEARTAARDLTPFSASHTFNEQADLLEMCADRIVANRLLAQFPGHFL